jgi:hypothetical protein
MLLKLSPSHYLKIASLKLPLVTFALALISSFGFATIVTAQGLPVTTASHCQLISPPSSSSLSVSVAPTSQNSIQL